MEMEEKGSKWGLEVVGKVGLVIVGFGLLLWKFFGLVVGFVGIYGKVVSLLLLFCVFFVVVLKVKVI